MFDRSAAAAQGSHGEQVRRSFLVLDSGTVAAWSLIASRNPAADARAAATTEVNTRHIEAVRTITVIWTRTPVSIHQRTPEEIALTKADDSVFLPLPKTDRRRVQRVAWLVSLGVCCHLSCIPQGAAVRRAAGQWRGWVSPYHGSHFDISGRNRRGSVPQNFEALPYTFPKEAWCQLYRHSM